MNLHSFERIGGDVALDFVNTANRKGEEISSDRLGDYRSLVAWAREARLPAGAAPEFADSAEAVRVADLARRVREILHEIFSAAAESRAPEQRRLAQFNAALSAALDRLEVAFARKFSWAWISPKDELERPLWPVLWAAAKLLTGGETGRIRRCANPECGRLYLDRSRRGNRRWCSMKTCGNRAKARRHYAKLHKRRHRTRDG